MHPITGEELSPVSRDKVLYKEESHPASLSGRKYTLHLLTVEEPFSVR
jgi:hypothetical protein